MASHLFDLLLEIKGHIRVTESANNYLTIILIEELKMENVSVLMKYYFHTWYILYFYFIRQISWMICQCLIVLKLRVIRID